MNALRPLPLLFALALAPLSALATTCDAALFGDGVCDCGCGTTDPDCPSGTFTVCKRSHCPSGQVPWEHAPASCMISACGDGWADPASGEACDDGNALASGGCSADCHTVSSGYTCGELAAGCKVAPASPDAGSNQVDAGTQQDAGTTGTGGSQADAGTGGAAPPAGGCTAAPSGPALLLAAWAASRLRRRNG